MKIYAKVLTTAIFSNLNDTEEFVRREAAMQIAQQLLSSPYMKCEKITCENFEETIFIFNFSVDLPTEKETEK